MKRLLKRLAERAGLEIRRRDDRPRFLDAAEDVNRLPLRHPIETVLDVGANVGQSALNFAGRFPAARIYAFEPVAETYARLVDNVRHLPSAECHQLAFGSMPGEQTIVLQRDSEWNSLVDAINASRQPDSRTEQVAVQTIDAWAGERGIDRIDLLKTDTEGFDLEVLRGAGRFLTEARIMFVLSEVGFRRDDRRHTFFPEVNDFLRSRSFGFCGLYDVHPSGSPRDVRFCNALFVHCEAIKNRLASDSMAVSGSGDSQAGHPAGP